MLKDISLQVRNYIGDIKYFNAPQQFADTTDGSSELELEMRRYAPKFLEDELKNCKWELHLDSTGEVINGFGYSDEIRDILINHLPNFTIKIDEEK